MIDANGNQKRITDANAHATNYSYDLFNRLSTSTYANGSVFTQQYDKNSNITNIIKPSTAPNPTIVNAYNALNRLTSKTYPQTPVLNSTFGYDLGSRMTDANNTAVANHFVYDNLNRRRVQDPKQGQDK